MNLLYFKILDGGVANRLISPPGGVMLRPSSGKRLKNSTTSASLSKSYQQMR